MKTFTATTDSIELNDLSEYSTETTFIFNQPQRQLTQDEYEADLKRRQEEHLKSVFPNKRWQTCLHDGCPNCHGTGFSKFGGICVHNLSCPCPKCSPSCL